VLVDSAEDVDLVVVGSRGLGGFKELLLGSISYRTAAHATAPVAVIREGSDDLDGRRGIVVGIDGSRAARRALRWACDEAGRRGVGVTVVHAYDLPTDSSLMGMVTPTLERYRTGLADEAVALVDRAIADVDLPTSTDVERVVKPGMPAAVLLSHAGGERLLVVGTHGRGAIGRALLGSVSHQCLHHASGPVVVVP
jgi:nucleotide-binding universal stress UspA family protein